MTVRLVLERSSLTAEVAVTLCHRESCRETRCSACSDSDDRARCESVERGPIAKLEPHTIHVTRVGMAPGWSRHRRPPLAGRAVESAPSTDAINLEGRDHGDDSCCVRLRRTRERRMRLAPDGRRRIGRLRGFRNRLYARRGLRANDRVRRGLMHR